MLFIIAIYNRGDLVKILYVIGNGFDLWHGLPTSYNDFCEYAADLLGELAEYFNSEPDDTPLWSNFEDDLGRFDWQLLFDAHNEIDISDEGFKPSMVYGLEDALDEGGGRITESIQNALREWVETIEISRAERKFTFAENCKILSFNYTATIQELYQVGENEILQIHGKAGDFSLIVGHGRSISEVPELDENGNTNRHLFSDAEGAAKAPLYRLKKPVEEIIEQNQDYFGSLGEAKVVAILGHSLNDIDFPYMRQIKNSASTAEWIVSYHTEEEAINHRSKLINLGVEKNKIHIVSMGEISQAVQALSDTA